MAFQTVSESSMQTLSVQTLTPSAVIGVMRDTRESEILLHEFFAQSRCFKQSRLGESALHSKRNVC
jgi:hypothetical protein